MIEMTAELAEKAVKAAQAKARELKANMTVSVVDESGRLVMTVRGNGCGYFTADTSRGKATASAPFAVRQRPWLRGVMHPFSSPCPALCPARFLSAWGGCLFSKTGAVLER